MTDIMHDTEDETGTFEDFDELGPDNDFLTIIRVSIANDGLNPLITCQPVRSDASEERSVMIFSGAPEAMRLGFFLAHL